MIDVSVIVCTKNRPELLLRCLKSILSQKGVQLEVVVVNDGEEISSDHAVKALLLEANVKCLSTADRRGVAAATKRGVEASVGRYIALLGDDDYFLSADKLAIQLREHNESENPDMVLSGTWWNRLDREGSQVKVRPKLNEPLKLSSILSSGVGICGSTAFFSRYLWDLVGGMDTKMLRGTDSDLFRRMMLARAQPMILPLTTTVVDVGHDQGRITPMETQIQIKGGLRVHLYTLYKYRWLFLRCPSAVFFRLQAVTLLLTKYMANWLKT